MDGYTLAAGGNYTKTSFLAGATGFYFILFFIPDSPTKILLSSVITATSYHSMREAFLCSDTQKGMEIDKYSTKS